MKKIVVFSLFISTYSCIYAQIGVNTPKPTKTLDVNGNMRIRKLDIINSPVNVLAVDHEGSVKKREDIQLSPSLGDIKYGMQKNDHSGWFLINGRNINTLPFEKIKKNAYTLGFSDYLWDARDRYIKYTSGSNGSLGGSHTVKLTTQNLPSYNVSTASATSGGHSHNLLDHHMGSAGLYAVNDRRGKPNNKTGVDKRFQDRTQTRNTNANSWSHTHTATASIEGQGQTFSIEPEYLTMNLFIYLGE
ncbi:hypothetical protein [Chryseobacterium sp. JV558]|uniref:hypothetical protein n=1 Tax=Chryseobacterium sp. JV558 TaxID=2663236 RepID=UPI00299D3839|nr:hypothetical protein [Chryseobacterium sp. JV558]MDW9378750.1 hypothetical protein [Chryseobacterium sp. JV558]